MTDASPETYKNRLLTLADFLDTLTDAEYNAQEWAKNTNGTQFCNTVGCTLMWAATLPEFQSAGMTMVNVNLYGDVYGTTYVCLTSDASNPDYVISHTDPQKAGMFVFGLTDEEYNSIFNPNQSCDWFPSISPDMNATGGTYASHIRNFVTHKYP